MKITVIKNIGNQWYDVCVCDDNFNEVIETIGHFNTLEEADIFSRLLKRIERLPT